jgi:hypothetical protein
MKKSPDWSLAQPGERYTKRGVVFLLRGMIAAFTPRIQQNPALQTGVGYAQRDW